MQFFRLSGAALNDAIASYQWALVNAASFNGDPSKVAGESESADLRHVLAQ